MIIKYTTLPVTQSGVFVRVSWANLEPGIAKLLGVKDNERITHLEVDSNGIQAKIEDVSRCGEKLNYPVQHTSKC